MNLSQTGLDFLKQWEGLRLRPYDDGYGTLTIGYGHAIKKGESFGTITPERAEQLLAQDAAYAVGLVGQSVSAPLSQSQFDASVSLAYNWGGFPRSEYVQFLNAGDYDSAADILGRYPVTSKGKYSQGLANRRAAERDLFYGYDLSGQQVYEDEQGIVADPEISIATYESGDNGETKSGELFLFLGVAGLGLLLFAIVASGSSSRR